VWKPINKMRMYGDCQSYRVESANEIYDTCINIPSSAGISEGDIKTVAAEIRGYFRI